LGGGKASSQVLSGHKDYVLSVDTTPDGKWIVSGSKDRGVQFWDIRTGSTQFMLQGHKNSGKISPFFGIIPILTLDFVVIDTIVISVAASPGRRPLFASGSGDNRARIWSFEALNA
jgi:glucose repression regulatory protein TUP1